MQRPQGSSPPWRPSSPLSRAEMCRHGSFLANTPEAEAANSSSGACWSEGGGDGMSRHAQLCVCLCVPSMRALCVEGGVCAARWE